MTHAQHQLTWWQAVAAAAVAIILAGLAGCTVGPGSRVHEIVRQSTAPAASAAPENSCAAFACEL
jgi:hypothetical protein